MNDVSIHIFQHDDIGFVTAMGVSGGVRRPFWDKGSTLGVDDMYVGQHSSAQNKRFVTDTP